MKKIVSKSARKITKALFATARPEEMSQVCATLKELVAAWSTDQAITAFFMNPAVELASKKEVLQTLSAQLQLSANFSNFLQIMVDNNRLSLLPEISEEYQSLYNHYLKSLELDITSASPLGAEEQSQLVSFLKSNFGSGVQVNWHSNPELIGGFIVKSGDQLLDSSISGALEKIKASLLN